MHNIQMYNYINYILTSTVFKVVLFNYVFHLNAILCIFVQYGKVNI